MRAGTAPFNVPAFPVAHFLSQKIDWFGTVRGRVGSTITPSLLVYVTGGLAYGQVDSTSTVSGINIFGAQGANTFTLVPAAVAFSSRTTKTGWTLGVGGTATAPPPGRGRRGHGGHDGERRDGCHEQTERPRA